MSQPGITEIGKYRIVEQVGEGAMGVVYRAVDPVLNRPVAVKVMCDAVARDDDLRGRFLREAQAAGSLQHPNVITIYDFGEVDGHLFIAMEFVEGQDLEDLAAKNVALPLIDKLDIVIDVLSGLAFAHKRGIVHRDIKPANIRIDEGRARVMDFGIAHLSASSMTRTGIMVGTPAYMAPEQIVGTPVSPATDLFSVGTVLYELLSGSKPFQAETIQGIMYQIVSQPAPPLDAVKLGIPPALEAVVNRAMSKDAQDRYQSALEMANALTAIRASLDRQASGWKTVSLRSIIDMGLTAERAAKQRKSTRHVALIGGSAAAAAIALALLGVFVLRDKAPPAPQVGASVAAVGSPPERPRDTSPTSPATSNSTTPAPNAATVSAQTQQADPKSPAKAEAKGPTTQEVLLVRALQTTALDSRRRATEAGATAEQLRAGDNHNRAAESLVSAGKISEAAVKLNDATTAWSAAERDARLAASAATAALAASARTKTMADSPKSDPPTTPVSSSVVPPQVAPIKPSAPAANPSAEIESAVAAYARAIESRDIAEVRRAYPGITAAQASGFEQFFTTVRSLRAAFSVSSLDVSGATAEGKLAGTYDYLTNAGKSERQAVTFQATFRHDANGWKLASVR
jgi:serine/threonine-protein kinase